MVRVVFVIGISRWIISPIIFTRFGLLFLRLILFFFFLQIEEQVEQGDSGMVITLALVNVVKPFVVGSDLILILLFSSCPDC